MNRKISHVAAVAAAFITLLFFSILLTIYIKPMEDISLDLSLTPNLDAAVADPAKFDAKGWTVYLCDQDKVTELTPDGYGGYFGIELGQTFYFSRVMEEALDTPTLQLGTVNRKFSVWLDDMLIYTDCPELDNRIGYVQLPMNDWDRTDSITISLPQDYRGKTLTIAQSFPPYTEGGSVKAYPCSVKLYCGYAYESALISESFQTAFLTIITFSIGVVLMFSFLRTHNIGTLSLALTAFLWMTHELISVSFYFPYFGTHISSVTAFCRPLILFFLLLFLTTQAGRFRRFQAVLLGIYGASLAVQGIVLFCFSSVNVNSFIERYLGGPLQQWVAFFTLFSILLLGILYWRKENRFYRYFSRVVPVALLLYWGYLLAVNQENTLFQITTQLQEGRIDYLLHHSSPPVILATIVLALIDTLKTEFNRRMEKRLLEERRDLTLASYNNLRLQHEEIMMLRHDMVRHFRTLRELSGEKQVTAYLDELLEQNLNIRPVVQTGNHMLDIILNSKLSQALDHQVRLDIVRASAPGTLPLSDADLCSLVMNILDNAIAAATAPDIKDPYLKLDIHVKNDYLAFVCENAVGFAVPKEKDQKETVPKHGLGMKIIRSITESCHGLIDTEETQDSFSIRVVIPIHPAAM